MEALERHNPYYENLSRKAEEKGKVLRYVAKLEGDVATVALEAFGMDHPFYFLSGSDNMVVFTTERYNERPLVVRGPGAGAEVTAAGVFAELIRMLG
jgi:aspartokinase/homoserine dehydrogenase 1